MCVNEIIVFILRIVVVFRRSCIEVRNMYLSKVCVYLTKLNHMTIVKS